MKELKHSGSFAYCLACTKAIEVDYNATTESYALAIEQFQKLHDMVIAHSEAERLAEQWNERR